MDFYPTFTGPAKLSFSGTFQYEINKEGYPVFHYKEHQVWILDKRENTKNALQKPTLPFFLGLPGKVTIEVTFDEDWTRYSIITIESLPANKIPLFFSQFSFQKILLPSGF